MPTDTKTSDIKPPYISYKTLDNFITSLRESSIPSRIDRSVLPGMSGATQSFLLVTLKFLGLTTEDGTPTAQLKDLVTNPRNGKSVLSKAVREKYDFLLNGQFDAQAATAAQFDEKFKERGLSGQTLRKCSSFFVAICEAAGITISPHLRSKRGNGNGSATGTRRPYKKRRPASDVDRTSPQSAQTSQSSSSLQDKLLAKFPEFNPKWDAEMQKKWFETFEQFMKAAKNGDASPSK